MEPVTLVSSIIQILIGIILLFLGNKSVRLFLVITGLMGGYNIGLLAINSFSLTDNLKLIVPIVMAILGALLLSTMLSYAFFLAGMFVGWQVGVYILGIAKLDFNYLIPILAAILGGILISMFQDEFIMIATAFIGSALLLDGGLTLYYQNQGLENTNPLRNILFSKFFNLEQNLILVLVVGLMTFIGFKYQKKHD